MQQQLTVKSLRRILEKEYSECQDMVVRIDYGGTIKVLYIEDLTIRSKTTPTFIPDSFVTICELDKYLTQFPKTSKIDFDYGGTIIPLTIHNIFC